MKKKTTESYRIFVEVYDEELEALLDQDSSQTQEELGVTQQAISHRLKQWE